LRHRVSGLEKQPPFTRQRRRVCLTATRDSVLLHLPLRAIDEIVKRDPSAWRLFGLLTIEHLDNAIGSSDDLMMRDHAKRFMAVLLRIGNCRMVNPRHRRPIEIDINHEDLANMANVARTTAELSCESLKQTVTLPCHTVALLFSRQML
jgi:CRP/FNR family cyclic AMP-dependent transcriptional regulator